MWPCLPLSGVARTLGGVTEFDGLPVLRNPVAIAAFEGWNDAADASTAAVEHLEQVWTARPVTALAQSITNLRRATLETKMSDRSVEQFVTQDSVDADRSWLGDWSRRHI